ncbi:E3 ubiquitin-protein ligase At4g11680-like [Tasmannia lanceolata]|uniref:E3 ubiquitin-protein ligase At4g11680-like n=1 Tax=Tasmannia lanceolata TaxID=3420 RepID=UPI004062E827
MEEEPSSRGFDHVPLLQTPTRRNPNPNSNNRNPNFSLLISRATSRRIMREPSMLVRETAALQLEEHQTDWGYSKPVVVLDLIWNFAFVLLSVVVLSLTVRERPSTPLRVWIAGYAIQCLFHVGFVYFEYRRRNRAGQDEEVGMEGQNSIAKKLESVNTMISFVWWIIGFYWIVIGGQAVLQDAPRLYWLTVVFLAFDVFFAIFCVALACFIGIALCCCLPCIIAFLYSVAGQEGASDADINGLPKFTFRQVNRAENFDLERPAVAVTTAEPSARHSTNEVSLSPEDSECCICLSQYEDGVELHSLPCNHYFHSGCIVKWLRINATCPLCKFNILKADEQV